MSCLSSDYFSRLSVVWVPPKCNMQPTAGLDLRVYTQYNLANFCGVRKSCMLSYAPLISGFLHYWFPSSSMFIRTTQLDRSADRPTDCFGRKSTERKWAKVPQLHLRFPSVYVYVIVFAHSAACLCSRSRSIRSAFPLAFFHKKNVYLRTRT